MMLTVGVAAHYSDERTVPGVGLASSEKRGASRN